jgi:hypothetical protein
MFKRLRLLFLVTILFVLCSCASGVPFTELNPSLQPESPGTGRIFFYRPTGLGAAVAPDVHLNNEVVGKALACGFFYVDRPAGDYTVVTATEVKRKASFVLDEDQTRYIRFKVSMGFFVGHVYGELVDEQTALPEIKKCKLNEAAKAEK